MRDAVEGIRRDIQAQLQQNQVESRRRENEMQESVAKLALKLEQLMHQLNEYRLV